MQLVLERCTIRDWRLDDAALLAKHANNLREQSRFCARSGKKQLCVGGAT